MDLLRVWMSWSLILVLSLGLFAFYFCLFQLQSLRLCFYFIIVKEFVWMFICIQICIQQSIKRWHVREQPVVYGRVWKEEWENDVLISSKIKVIIFIKKRILLGCCVVPANNKSTGYHVAGKIKSFFAFKCSNVNFCILYLYKIYVLICLWDSFRPNAYMYFRFYLI